VAPPILIVPSVIRSHGFGRIPAIPGFIPVVIEYRLLHASAPDLRGTHLNIHARDNGALPNSPGETMGQTGVVCRFLLV